MVHDFRELNSEQRKHFRDQLRIARMAALDDAESSDEILFAIERLGHWRLRREKSLSIYEDSLAGVVRCEDRELFRRLYRVMTAARNSALHQGAFARHLARHAVEVSIYLEDGLMADASTVGDFMVTNPNCAAPWQLTGHLRREMLAHSFSFLPVKFGDVWMLVSDAALGKFLRSGEPRVLREKTLEEAVAEALQLEVAQTVAPDTPIGEALTVINRTGAPALVLNEGGHLVGIVAAFDLL